MKKIIVLLFIFMISCRPIELFPPTLYITIDNESSVNIKIRLFSKKMIIYESSKRQDTLTYYIGSKETSANNVFYSSFVTLNPSFVPSNNIDSLYIYDEKDIQLYKQVPLNDSLWTINETQDKRGYCIFEYIFVLNDSLLNLIN